MARPRTPIAKGCSAARNYISTGRICRYCGKEIFKVEDRNGIIIFDARFYCYRNECLSRWKTINLDDEYNI